MYRQQTARPASANPQVAQGAGIINVPLLDGARHGNVWRTRLDGPEPRIHIDSTITQARYHYTLAKMVEDNPEFGHPYVYVFTGMRPIPDDYKLGAD